MKTIMGLIIVVCLHRKAYLVMYFCYKDTHILYQTIEAHSLLVCNGFFPISIWSETTSQLHVLLHVLNFKLLIENWQKTHSAIRCSKTPLTCY